MVCPSRREGAWHFSVSWTIPSDFWLGNPALGRHGGCRIDSYKLAWGGVLLGLSIAAPLGPVNVEIIRRGLRSGFQAALRVGLGSTLAELLYVAITYLGVAPLISRPSFRIALYIAAALVLGALAKSSLKEAFASKEAHSAGEAPPPGPVP